MAELGNPIKTLKNRFCEGWGVFVSKSVTEIASCDVRGEVRI